jgi:hypothetical protein
MGKELSFFLFWIFISHFQNTYATGWIQEEGLDEIYIKKLKKYNLSDREILEKARNRKRYDNWAKKKILHINDDFVGQLETLNLNKKFEGRIKKIYALCIQSYQNQEDQSFMRKIEIGEPIPKYRQAPHFHPLEQKPTLNYSTDLKDPNYRSISNRNKAFYLILAYAQKTSDNLSLDDYNKACLAKCIADEALQYIPPSQNPLLALRAFTRSFARSPAANLSHPYGVCTNYATLTASVAQALGFGEKVQIHREGKHFFNQFYIKNTWYHFHPLRKYGK